MYGNCSRSKVKVTHKKFTQSRALALVTLDSTLSVDKHIVDNESK